MTLIPATNNALHSNRHETEICTQTAMTVLQQRGCERERSLPADMMTRVGTQRPKDPHLFDAYPSEVVPEIAS